jgi:hypothetical protein
MADILALRATHGGASDAAADAEFAGALGRLIAEKHGAPVAIPEPVAPTAEPTNSALTALRTAAQHFDQRAAALEADKAYVEADAARETATALRREARRLDP